MHSSEFEKLYAQLNERQREAVDAIEGPVMVIAGPGTGKTKILTLRIANIIKKTDTSPEAILALTFTESGATEMRSRLAQMIGTDAYRVTVTTFHSFCNNIIQQYPEAFEDIAGAVPVSDTDQLQLLEELITSTEGLELLRPTGAPTLYLKAVLSAINSLKREDVSLSRLTDILNREESVTMNADDLYHEKGRYKGQMKGAYADELKQILKLRELALLYDKYQKALREKRLYDYNDMIMEVARVLEKNEQLRLMLQEANQYILVDEHQDTNNAQNRIIELLASFWESPNLFVVGDAKQAIYRFQGASLENFLYFKNLYPDVRLIELEDNYRSSQHILDAAHGIRPSAGNGLKARAGHDNSPIHILSLSDEDSERYAIAKSITERLSSGVHPEDIAVLYRDNSDGQVLASIFDKIQVPYTISADSDVLSDNDIRKLILLIDAVRAYGESGPLLEALHVDTLGLEPLDIYKLADFCRLGRNPYDVMRNSDLMHQAGIENVAKMSNTVALLTRWHVSARNETTLETFESIVRDSGILTSILSSERVGEKLAKLRSLYDAARSLVQRHRTASFLDFADNLRFIREHELVLKSGAGAPMPGKVRLMTAHKSKGLEFDHVYIIGATDDHWGPRSRRELIKLPQAVFLKTDTATEKESDGDERNVFYVALTRARKTATITMAQRDLAGRELLPCRFISDLKTELVSYPDTADYESSWMAHRDINFAAVPAKAPDITDKSFLNEAFLRQGLSATALNNYLNCPWKYFYRNLIRIPEAPAFPLMYGSAIDRALQEYFEKLKIGEDRGKDYLISTFRAFARHQPFQEQELASAVARGEKALSGYFDQRHSHWHQNVMNQFKVPAVAVSLSPGIEIILNGKMDRIDIIDASNHVIVVDYKTGKPKSRRELLGQTKDASGDYFRQLVFYNLLLNKYQDGHYKMTKGIIDFVDPDTKGNYKQEEFIIASENVSELEETIRRVAQEILDLSFWDKHCDDKDCQYCDFRRLIS